MADPVLEGIHAAMRLHYRGEVEQARERLSCLWEELEGGSNIYHRCVLAHHIADTQQDLQDELAWDLRALEAAGSIAPESAEDDPAETAAVRLFLPSLHLNLADDYRRLGDFARARHHVDRGGELSGALGLDAYGQTVRSALLRVDSQIEERDSGPAVIFDFD